MSIRTLIRPLFLATRPTAASIDDDRPPAATRSHGCAIPTAASRPGLPELIEASGGPRYGIALGVEALGTGLLRPFLLLCGIKILGLSSTTTGLTMTVGIVVSLACVPPVGRWLDRGARSTAVAASMLVRVAGVVLLLATPHGNVWGFGGAALFFGVGNQTWPVAHAALVATVSQGRTKDAALAAARSVRNAGLGLGALVVMGCLAGGPSAPRTLAAVPG